MLASFEKISFIIEQFSFFFKLAVISQLFTSRTKNVFDFLNRVGIFCYLQVHFFMCIATILLYSFLKIWQINTSCPFCISTWLCSYWYHTHVCVVHWIYSIWPWKILACEARYRNHFFSTRFLQKSLDLVVFCLL